MLRNLVKYSKWIIGVVGILIFFLTQQSWVVNSILWRKAEGGLIDQRYVWRGYWPDTNIVLVGVQTSSLTLDRLSPEEIEASPMLKLMKEPFAWDRRVFAATLDLLIEAGASSVVFDFVFASSKDGDEIFAKSLARHKDRVVIGTMIAGDENKFTPPTPVLLEAAGEGALGLVNLWPDRDDVVRRGKYRTSNERESPQLAEWAEGNVEDNILHMSAQAVRQSRGAVSTPPYGRDNFINFHGARKVFQSVPIENLFVPKLWQAPPTDGGIIFSNKIVIVGPMAEIFQDTHRTPFGEIPGPEIQGQMMATLLNGSSLKEPSPLAGQALTLVMVVLALVFCLVTENASIKPLLLVLLAAAFVVACQYLFVRHSLVVPMMPPLFGLVGTGSFAIVFQSSLEYFERRRYRNVLERYVSKSVAKTILDDQRGFLESLSGKKQTVAVLFSDIRGFTSMTEGTEPEKLVSHLNEYFLEMVGVVLHQNGTLQKFIGDAIMAAWGDTHSEGAAEDSRRAVRAALSMRTGLARLNERWKADPDRAPLSIGIGVNQGDVIVGNIGHPQRMEFTVLGDGVNLAARLESATKQFQTDILIGESIEKLTRDTFVFRRVGLLTVKGKTKPVEVFGVLSDRSQKAPEWLARYHEAIDLFRGREFAKAKQLFQSVFDETGGTDFLCENYAGRCADFIAIPPGEKWAGELVLTEK